MGGISQYISVFSIVLYFTSYSFEFYRCYQITKAEEVSQKEEETQALQRKLDAAQTQLAELMRTSGVQRALLEEELAAAREKNTAMKRAQDERRQDLESLRGELQRASEREESLQRQLAQQSPLNSDGFGTVSASVPFKFRWVFTIPIK